MKIWTDITQDQGGRYVAKDVFKALSFALGAALLVASAVACWFGKDVSIEGGVALLLLAFGIQVNKDWTSLAHRKVEVDAACETPAESGADTGQKVAD